MLMRSELVTSLWQHQREMSEFIYPGEGKKASLIAADKGTGKTLSVIDALVREFSDRKTYVLIVGPKLAITVWENEINRRTRNIAFTSITDWNCLLYTSPSPRD